MFRNSFLNKKRQRKIYFVKIVLQKFFTIELKFYRQLQKVFNKVSLLIYYNFIRVTYINVNIFKQRDFEIIIYYLKFNTNVNNFKQKKSN